MAGLGNTQVVRGLNITGTKAPGAQFTGPQMVVVGSSSSNGVTSSNMPPRPGYVRNSSIFDNDRNPIRAETNKSAATSLVVQANVVPLNKQRYPPTDNSQGLTLHNH